MQDQRRFPRFTLEPGYTRVIIQHVDGRAIEPVEGHAYDIGEGGVRMEADVVPPPGARIGLEMHLPGEGWPIPVIGRVVRQIDASDELAANRIAVAFHAFRSPFDRARLVRWLGRMPAGPLVDRTGEDGRAAA